MKNNFIYVLIFLIFIISLVLTFLGLKYALLSDNIELFVINALFLMGGILGLIISVILLKNK